MSKAERNTDAIRLTPLDAVPEPKNLRRIKAEVTRRWGVVDLLDILKEGDRRIGFTSAFSASRVGGVALGSPGRTAGRG